MNIEVLFFGQLRELASVHGTNITINDGASIANLLGHLGEKYGVAFRRQVKNARGLRILINGREHTLLGGKEAFLKDGDTVVFLPPIFGG